MTESHPTRDQARAAKQILQERLAGVDGVVGVGITRVGANYAIKLNLREPLPPDVELPEQIEGVPVRVEVIGRIRPLS